MIYSLLTVSAIARIFQNVYFYLKVFNTSFPQKSIMESWLGKFWSCYLKAFHPSCFQIQFLKDIIDVYEVFLWGNFFICLAGQKTPF